MPTAVALNTNPRTVEQTTARRPETIVDATVRRPDVLAGRICNGCRIRVNVNVSGLAIRPGHADRLWRVSTRDQHPQAQHDALTRSGVQPGLLRPGVGQAHPPTGVESGLAVRHPSRRTHARHVRPSTRSTIPRTIPVLPVCQVVGDQMSLLWDPTSCAIVNNLRVYEIHTRPREHRSSP
jgi:hypothetical protein